MVIRCPGATARSRQEGRVDEGIALAHPLVCRGEHRSMEAVECTSSAPLHGAVKDPAIKPSRLRAVGYASPGVDAPRPRKQGAVTGS